MPVVTPAPANNYQSSAGPEIDGEEYCVPVSHNPQYLPAEDEGEYAVPVSENPLYTSSTRGLENPRYKDVGPEPESFDGFNIPDMPDYATAESV